MALGRRTTPRHAPADDEAVGLQQEVVDEITWYMREHKVTRSDLAAAMGVSPGRVSQILSGGENLTLRTLGSVVSALGARFEISLHPDDDLAKAH
ncbi:MAG TPA: helix-turn-helix transcriptional regulator [Streptosporangiaceae bacterium]|nr:helix-turn-helix transcriptional regulator [Streptosporangiaceae bacterium]